MITLIANSMDKQTAINLLDNLVGMVEDTQENDYDTALKMGIEALKAHTQSETDLTTNIENVLSLLNEINSSGRMDYGDYCALYDAIEVLLPVRYGHLVGIDYDGYADGSPVYDVWQCSECGWIYEGEDPHFNYCPDCGARLEL